MKIFAWCDSPQAPTGFGKSSNHVLHALHGAGWELVQLAVNQDPGVVQAVPWKVYQPLDRANDPYGLVLLPEVLRSERPDMMWTTFDPEVPWKYAVPGVTSPIGRPMTAIDFILGLRESNPGFRTMAWLTVDGGPLSDFELQMLGMGPQMDYAATMSPHVRGLVEWTLRLKNLQPNEGEIEKRLNVIPGGVDVEQYSPPTADEKAEARRKLGLPADAFIVLQLERNQQRKQNYLGLEVMEVLLKRFPNRRGRILLYQHMIPDEENGGCQLGFNLPNLAWRYGLAAGRDVKWPVDFLPKDRMPLVYKASDAFLSTSAGEGFQYPAWEALACGVPLVVPGDTSRTAWLKGAPNVALYSCADRRVVMKGSYHRRMSAPDPGAAASKLSKLLVQGPKPGAGKAAHDWVARTASVGQVQAKWLEVVEEQAAILKDMRRQMQVVVEEDVREDTLTVVMESNPGLGDVVLAAPAVAALRAKVNAEGRKLHFRVPPPHLPIVKVLDCADAYETKPHRGGTELFIDYLYKDGHRDGWGDPDEHRTDVIARYLGVDPGELRPAIASIPQPVQDRVRSQFTDTFTADPATCVGIALESANPHRAMPKAYARILSAGVRGMGLTPVMLGRTHLGVQDVGTIDLTGKTDLVYLIGLVEQLGAVVTTDSATLHFAGMVGTPMVACFTLFSPGSRLKYYAGQIESVVATGPIGEEDFPAGPHTKAQPGAWAATIRPEMIMSALRKLLGTDSGAPKIVRLDGTSEGIA